MKGILSGLKNILDFIKLFARFMNNMLNNTWKVLKWVGAVASKTGAIILTLPDYIQIFATITITVCILYLILGRSHGKSVGE